MCSDEVREKLDSLEKMVATAKEQYLELGGVLEDPVEQSKIEADHKRLVY